LTDSGLRVKNPKESRRSRLEFVGRMERRRLEANDPSTQQIRRGWCFGAEDFVARLLDRLPGSVSEQHHARERKQTDEQKAEAIAFSDARRVIVQSF
jgi:hypothetical protein